MLRFPSTLLHAMLTLSPRRSGFALPPGFHPIMIIAGRYGRHGPRPPKGQSPLGCGERPEPPCFPQGLCRPGPVRARHGKAATLPHNPQGRTVPRAFAPGKQGGNGSSGSFVGVSENGGCCGVPLPRLAQENEAGSVSSAFSMPCLFGEGFSAWLGWGCFLGPALPGSVDDWPDKHTNRSYSTLSGVTVAATYQFRCCPSAVPSGGLRPT